MEEYEPRNRGRQGAILGSLLTATSRTGEEGMARIESWQRDLVEYVAPTTDRIPDSIKLNVLVRGQEDEALRRHLQLSAGRLATYETSRNEVHDILYRREWKTVIAQAQPMRAIVAKALARSTPKELAEEKEQGQESSFFPLCVGTVFTMVTVKRNRKTRDERQSGQKGATNAAEDQPAANADGQPQRYAGQFAIPSDKRS